MLLAIDVGNTNTVIGLYEGLVLHKSWRIKTDSSETADELALKYKGLLANEPAASGVALCSTVPAVLHQMRLMIDRYFSDLPTVIVEPGIKSCVIALGIRFLNHVDNRESSNRVAIK